MIRFPSEHQHRKVYESEWNAVSALQDASAPESRLMKA